MVLTKSTTDSYRSLLDIPEDVKRDGLVLWISICNKEFPTITTLRSNITKSLRNTKLADYKSLTEYSHQQRFKMDLLGYEPDDLLLVMFDQLQAHPSQPFVRAINKLQDEWMLEQKDLDCTQLLRTAIQCENSYRFNGTSAHKDATQTQVQAMAAVLPTLELPWNSTSLYLVKSNMIRSTSASSSSDSKGRTDRNLLSSRRSPPIPMKSRNGELKARPKFLGNGVTHAANG